MMFTVVCPEGLQDIPIPKSLVMGCGALASIGCVWYLGRKVRCYAAIAPYNPTVAWWPHRAAQRCLINNTRVDLAVTWNPTDSLIERRNRRIENGHAISGSVRDAARETIDAAVVSSGFTSFEISPYKRSNVEKRCTPHYSPADLAWNYEIQEPGPSDVIVGIDIDYYLTDMDRWLAYGRPLVLFTFQPRKVAGMDGDSPFRIINNEIRYEVSGGNRWNHRVWNWCASGEFVRAVDRRTWRSWFMGWFGIQKVVYQKIVTARPWAECSDRCLVWTLPVCSHWEFGFIESDMNARSLQRVNYADPTRPGWNSIIHVADDNQLYISLGREGEDCEVTILKENLDVLLGLKSSQSVTSRMIGMGYKEQKTLALVGQYYNKNVVDPVNSDRVLKSASPRVHWPASFEVDVPEVSARVYSSPLVTDANMVPMIRRWEALSNSLEARVTAVVNDKRPSSKYDKYATEFVRLVVPTNIAGKGVRYDDESTIKELNKPSQVLGVKQIWETIDLEPRKLIECFLKNEPCMKNGRIISSFPDYRYLVKFSSYTLNFRDMVLHNERNAHWFYPGRTPENIAKGLCDYVSSIDEPAETDFSNFDGTISAWLQRRVMNACYLRYFGAEEELKAYTDMLITCPARAKRFNFKYEPGPGVKSGSPTTCDANTIADAFVEYCSIRETLPDLKPIEAYALLGPKFGDDGITRREFVQKLNRVCRDLGLVCKVERFRPDQGLTFLARVYPDPWNTTTSFQDPLRTWRKLHITMRDPNVPIGTAATDRLEGYLVTDALTPITAEFCKTIIRCYRDEVNEDARRDLRKSKDKEKPYWLTSGAWPQGANDVGLMEQCIAARLGMDVEDIRNWNLRIAACNNPWAIPTVDRELIEPVGGDALDEDGLPIAGPVNERVIANARDVQRNRANPEIANGGEGERGADHARPVEVAGNGGQRGAAGPGQLPGLPQRAGDEGGEGRGRPAGENPRAGVPHRQGHHARPDRPHQGDRPAPNRDRQVGGRPYARRGDHRRAGRARAGHRGGGRQGA